MKAVSTCPVCGSGDVREVSRAVVAPFLAARIWSRDSFPAVLAGCGSCGFLFFNPRMGPEEEERLYREYRGAEYLKCRHASEPWYTARFNASLTDPSFLQTRKAKVAEILRRHLPGNRPYRILDFGGAHGELVQDLLPGCVPYVYEISHVEPLDGVTVCADLDDCRGHEFDAILCSNVLEHVGFPRAIIEQIQKIATPKTFIWVEVPQENPNSWNLRLRRLMQEMVLLAFRPRVGLSLLRPGGLCWMHEHINFFNVRSLEALFRAVGWDVFAAEAYPIGGSVGGEMAWAIGKAAAGS
jgi:Methyltransferase domain